MPGLVRRERKGAAPQPTEVFDPFGRMFEPMFDDWGRWLPLRLPRFLGRHWTPQELIPVEEYRENDALVVRAELPGIDPDKDVEITVSDGTLHISAERREEEKGEEKDYWRHELRYGSFSRTLELPEGATESDVKASYKDGILEIRIPAREAAPAKKVSITKS